MVVRPVFGDNGSIKYRVQIARKAEAPAFGPVAPVAAGELFDAITLRTFLLDKCKLSVDAPVLIKICVFACACARLIAVGYILTRVSVCSFIAF